MISVQSETLDQAWTDLVPLILSYWREAEVHRHYQGIDLRRDRYDEYERAGMLHCVTVRDDGRLVGYALGYISVSMRSQVNTWGDDMFYLLPSYRGRTAGPRMLRLIEEYCRDHQVAEIVLNARADGDLPDILGRLDYTPVSVQYSKRLGCADSAYRPIAVTKGINDVETKSAENA
jgi:L-amino acid N-acyltransferase YncA